MNRINVLEGQDMMMKHLKISLLPFLLPAIAYSSTIDLECKVKPYGETYAKFLQDSKNDHSTTANDIKRDSDIINLSIDTEKEEVKFPRLYDTRIVISPTNFIITSYLHCENQGSTACKDKIFNYRIDRISGIIEGSKYSGDNSWIPYFKSGDLMWQFHGTCDTLTRKF